MKSVAIVPARGGSKGIPDKNIIDVNGKPMIQYTIDAALSSKLDKVVVSSDSDKILSISSALGADVVKRPEALSTDNASTIDAVMHLLESLDDEYDVVMILQPTSPLRESSDIDKALDLFKDKDADSLVSVVQVPHNMTPASLMVKDGYGMLTHYESGEKCYRRQDKPVFYARNGAAIYITKTSKIKEGILCGKIASYEMPFIRSFDVDEMEDLELVRTILAIR